MRLVIGISGGSGSIYALRLLEVLHTLKIETHLIVSKWAKECIRIECDKDIDYLISLVDTIHDNNNLTSAPASGSFKTNGMIIIPCSMKTLASIANGYDNNLIARAASVTIKEGRKLVLVPRETPLTAIHLENMLRLARLGVTILPAMPGFYHKPKSIDELLNHIVGKILDQFNIEHEIFKRWKGEEMI
ncbi:MAG: UbiX family flavin prenyltransferase [Candidatus Nitrosocaldaceae archaeon]